MLYSTILVKYLKKTDERKSDVNSKSSIFIFLFRIYCNINNNSYDSFLTLILFYIRKYMSNFGSSKFIVEGNIKKTTCYNNRIFSKGKT